MWSKKDEVDFFNKAKSLASIENLMVNVKGKYFAFQPKTETGKVNTPQSRNSFIGSTTEKWCKDLFLPIARHYNLYAVNGVVCDEVGLSRQSPADMAFCTTDGQEQRADNIKLIFEIKMGIVNNYIYNDDDEFEFYGDYTTHKGNPSFLRSDSMLKAIGKSINLRVDSSKAKKIPIIILGNSPITSSYVKKVDCLKQSGVIQKFISLYPDPTKQKFISHTKEKGFETFDSPIMIEKYIDEILHANMNYFSSMLSNKALGELISKANKEDTDELKGQKFIELLGA